MPRRKTSEEVIASFHNVHGGYYDYSSVKYVNAAAKVTIRCPAHGDFEITPGHHARGVGCRKCHFGRRRTSREDFLVRAEKHFGDRYDYSRFGDLPEFGAKVPILCRDHGEIFWQEPKNHMRGHTGCSRCKAVKQSGPARKRGTFKQEADLTKAFIERAVRVHGDKYDYRQLNYVTMNTKGKIGCPRHGDFWQAPCNHLRGSGCPHCSRERRKADAFKARCKSRGVDYWRALKRREAGLPDDKVFLSGYVRSSREINPITVCGIDYPNLEEAVRVLQPPASSATIGRWLEKGMPPEAAFERVPNPGYAKGIIYLVTHWASGKQYVGLTVQTLERRWRMHREQALSGSIKEAESLHAALREFGPEAFEVHQIDQGTTKKDLEARERYWIEELHTLVPLGYNISQGGVSGGANGKPVVVDEIGFYTVRSAAEYVAKTRGISVEAAKGRIRCNRIDVKAPAKPGESLVKTKCYKAWSRIVHGALNPNSKGYIPGIDIYEPWRTFGNFYKDVGNPPREGMAFARLDKNKGFLPSNCRWLGKNEASKCIGREEKALT